VGMGRSRAAARAPCRAGDRGSPRAQPRQTRLPASRSDGPRPLTPGNGFRGGATLTRAGHPERAVPRASVYGKPGGTDHSNRVITIHLVI
jgi:hypothetical protein